MTQDQTDQLDPFYSQDDLNQNLDEILATEVEEETHPIQVGADRDFFQLTPEEEKLLNELLKKKQKEDLILETYKSLESRPSDEEIQEWKIKFGEVYLVSLSEKENFLFKPLKRHEWRQLMIQIDKLPEHKKTEAIVMKGVIWPRLSQSNIEVLTAGAPDTLRNLILEASNFIDPDRAIGLVRKL